MKRIIYILAVLILFSGRAFSQLAPDDYKAHWIVNIAQKVTWPNEKSIDTFFLAVYGKSTSVGYYLRKLTKQQKIKNKPFKVKVYSRLSHIPFDKVNIIYVENSKNDYLPTLLKDINKRPILVISYRATDKDYIMINLVLKGKDQQFEVNSFNIKECGLVLDEALLKLGGTKVDIQGLLRKKELELLKKEKVLKAQKDSLEKQRKILLAKEQELQKLTIEIQKQRAELKQKELLLQQEKQKSGQLNTLIQEQESILKRNKQILAAQNEQIKQKQQIIQQKTKTIQERQRELKQKEQELKQKLAEINKQKKVLKNQKLVIKSQRIIIILSVIFSIIVIFLLIVIFSWYSRIKRLNEILKSKNEEILRQKDELQIQAKQLEEFNRELEKLSLVASRTNNSVIIMDKNGNIEWVNAGFTRLYGYTLQLLKNDLGGNILEISSHPKIRIFFEQCVNNKKTVTYEARNRTRDGHSIWVQTSLTPILNENDEVVKVFAIETDITKLKEQEQEIRQINEELRRQRDTLQEQKEQIEFQNKLIKDSIRYAQTIQSTILPPLDVIKEYFDVFVIYKPRDIVSGDFYWFAKLSEKEFFLAVVDCTGHGVPGAFMSLIASRMLSEIVLEKKITSPEEILRELNQTVINALNQRRSDNNDGMDVCLVKVDKQEQSQYQVTFAGAKRPLFYYKRETGKVQMIKGDRKPIGGKRAMQSPVEFKNKYLTLSANDIIYLTTDGMIDQNNPKRKRFGTPRFLDLLNEVKDFDLEKQQDYIEKTLRDFMADQPQRDDITIMGVKFR